MVLKSFRGAKGDGPESPERRAFFGRSGAAAVAAATGGDISPDLSDMTKIANASTTIQSCKRAIHDIRWTLTQGSGAVNERIIECLKGKPAWGIITDVDEHYERYEAKKNRIDFSDEEKIWKALKTLPKDEPLIDVLSEAALERVYGQETNPSDTFSAHNEVRNLRKLLSPLCDEQTTAADLTDNFRGFFEGLAEEAIRNPGSFISRQSSVKQNRPEDLNITSQINRLVKIFEEDGADPFIIEQLKEAAQRHVENDRGYIFDIFEKIRLEGERIEQERLAEAQRIQEEHQRAFEEELKAEKENPDLRYQYEINLTHISGKKCLLEDTYNIPARVDWLHWLQKEIDPAASPSDFHLPEDAFGRMIVFADTDIGLKAFEAVVQSEGCVALPNRRMNADLNQHIEEPSLF